MFPPPCSPMFFSKRIMIQVPHLYSTATSILLNLPSCVLPFVHIGTFAYLFFFPFSFPLPLSNFDFFQNLLDRSIHLHAGPQNILKFIYYDPCLLDWTHCSGPIFSAESCPSKAWIHLSLFNKHIKPIPKAEHHSEPLQTWTLLSWTWWHMSVTLSVFRRMKDCEDEARPSYIARPYR